jgi:iron complex outermembrane receptor protein
MDFGPDKMFDYGMMGSPSLGMPMSTAGKTKGISVKADLPLTSSDVLRVGGDVQQYRLEDWWPPVVDSMMMGPNAFLNIHHGERDRSALFGEWESHLSPQWLATFGLRLERVNTNTDKVHGYEQATFPSVAPMMDMMSQGKDGANFNNADRKKTDNNLDLTALARYTANPNYDIDVGFARKTRSPNLYERYTWSTAGMMAIMNNVVGDGNGYVGDVNLKPERANTLSATFDWHAGNSSWGFKTTPFYTEVSDYIDVVRLPSSVSMMGVSDNNASRTTGYVKLKYANQSARLYGLDVSGHMPLGTATLGAFGLKGLLNYTNGSNQDTGDELYNVMPLNAKLAITQQLGGWDNSLELVMVKDKSKVSDVRNEVKTAGYSLMNVRSSYTFNQVRLDFGVENLFNKFYGLPTGGAYTGQGPTMGINSIPSGVAVPGMGRSIYAGVNVKF